MKLPLVALVLASCLALTTPSRAHRPDDFDAGKKEQFEATAARNRTRLARAGITAWGSRPELAAPTGSAAAAATKRSGERRMTYARCVDGMAAETYECKNVDLLAHVDIPELGVQFVNDLWGWVDRRTRREYVLLGAKEGTVVVEITRPWWPKVTGFLQARASDPDRSLWNDIKVYKDHAFIVSEQRGHGLQVLDLRTLREIENRDEPVVLKAAATYDGFSSAHNLVINEDTGFAYAVGANVCRGGLEMIDIRDPAKPKDAGCFKKHGYIHDAQCVIYKGPDHRYRGREICFNAATGSNSGPPFDNTLSIVDVTDKSNVEAISNTGYGGEFGYSHQGWLTPDQRYYLHGDELDEIFEVVDTTTTRIWDLLDLRNPVVFATTTNEQESIDHNLYTRGQYSFASNYTTGLRIFDIRRVGDGRYEEVAFFDVYPENDNATFEGGTWSNYPYLSRRNVVAVSSMDRGLFILRVRLPIDD